MYLYVLYIHVYFCTLTHTLFVLFRSLSSLWRQENILQQELQSAREDLNKKEQALRSITGKVTVFPFYFLYFAYFSLIPCLPVFSF